MSKVNGAWAKDEKIYVKIFKDSIFKIVKGEGACDLKHRLNKPKSTPSIKNFQQEKIIHPTHFINSTKRADINTSDQSAKEGAKDVTSHTDTEGSENNAFTSTSIGHSTISSREK
ncbi:hypothetical protein PoB_003435500 [Plakobranchus ocellatus]|uniref:Uncharacterized protein n=1 Tax=Plakobranchus ocellatus TaxID=259542 RepID=A0AAV4AKF8_9GAST|nr:hypothetical protein PoB_003435500 [Plakobranchus ocellatus]